MALGPVREKPMTITQLYFSYGISVGENLAQICIDDSIESREEFWKLLPLVKGDRDLAMGKLVRFFRLAQLRYGKDLPVTREDLEGHGLEMMIDSGWALPIDGGFQAYGADKRFAWYRQKLIASEKGGAATKKVHEISQSNKNNELIRPAEGRESTSASPSSIASASVKKKEEEYTRSEILRLIEIWKGTLKFWGVDKVPIQLDVTMFKVFQKWRDFSAIECALLGPRFESDGATYKVRNFLTLNRFLDAAHFERMQILGSGKTSEPPKIKTLADLEAE